MPFFDMAVCGGCRTCEMACSFHHRGEFNPAISSIKIVTGEGEIPFRVWLAGKDLEDGTAAIPCDGCRDVEEPLCLQFCRKRDELRKILDEFAGRDCARGTGGSPHRKVR